MTCFLKCSKVFCIAYVTRKTFSLTIVYLVNTFFWWHLENYPLLFFYDNVGKV